MEMAALLERVGEQRQQIAQKIKKTTCSIETGMTSSFAVRGLTLDTRIKIIELVQFEDSKVMEQFNQRILHLTT